MKLRKLFGLGLAAVITALIGFTGVSASTSTEAATTTAVNYDEKATTAYIQYANMMEGSTDIWADDNDSQNTTCTSEIQTLKATYEKLELIKIVSGEDGEYTFVNCTDKPYKSYVLSEGFTNVQTKVYLLVTLKGKEAKQVYDAPADLTAESLTFTKHGGSSTVAISDDLYDMGLDCCEFTFTNKVKKYDCTEDNLTLVTDAKKKENATKWNSTPIYGANQTVYSCLEAIDNAGIDLPFVLVADKLSLSWNKYKKGLMILGISIGAIFAGAVLFLLVKGMINWLKH